MLRLAGRILKWFLIVFFGSSILAVVALRFIPVSVTPLMVIRSINPVGSDSQKERERHWKHDWVSYDDISPWMSKAVVASEDGNFYKHHGFDFKQIEKAVEEHKQGKRRKRYLFLLRWAAASVQWRILRQFCGKAPIRCRSILQPL